MPSTETTSSAEGASTPVGRSLIFKPDDWFKPLDWREVFPQEQPIEIDLGCGNGSFLLWAAGAYPRRNFLGVERLLRRLRRVDRKVLRGGLENVRLIRVEATYLITKLIPVGSVSTYHILFPDPWPKRRHHARRLISPDFLADVHRTMAPDGAINCATDHEEYFVWIQQAFARSARFAEAEPAILPPDAQTDFEKGFVAEGKPVHRSRWFKR
jgi:tRNA (guanine-N7-)-methyltransferase